MTFRRGAAASPISIPTTTTSLPPRTSGTLQWVYLHIVDTVALVHALIIRIQAIVLPLKALVLEGTRAPDRNCDAAALPRAADTGFDFGRKRNEMRKPDLGGRRHADRSGRHCAGRGPGVRTVGGMGLAVGSLQAGVHEEGQAVVFAEFSDLFGSGFIIDGNRIRGRTTNCTIKSRKQEGDSLELSSACASSIMTSNVRFLLKVIDDNNISRTVPDTEGMMLKYSRCSF